MDSLGIVSDFIELIGLVHAFTGGLSGSSPDQLFNFNKKGGDIMPKVEVKKVQEHYELYVNQTFMCSCDTNELNSSITEVYQLYYESITKTR